MLEQHLVYCGKILSSAPSIMLTNQSSCCGWWTWALFPALCKWFPQSLSTGHTPGFREFLEFICQHLGLWSPWEGSFHSSLGFCPLWDSALRALASLPPGTFRTCPLIRGSARLWLDELRLSPPTEACTLRLGQPWGSSCLFPISQGSSSFQVWGQVSCKSQFHLFLPFCFRYFKQDNVPAPLVDLARRGSLCVLFLKHAQCSAHYIHFDFGMKAFGVLTLPFHGALSQLWQGLI